MIDIKRLFENFYNSVVKSIEDVLPQCKNPQLKTTLDQSIKEILPQLKISKSLYFPIESEGLFWISRVPGLLCLSEDGENTENVQENESSDVTKSRIYQLTLCLCNLLQILENYKSETLSFTIIANISKIVHHYSHLMALYSITDTYMDTKNAILPFKGLANRIIQFVENSIQHSFTHEHNYQKETKILYQLIISGSNIHLSSRDEQYILDVECILKSLIHPHCPTKQSSLDNRKRSTSESVPIWRRVINKFNSSESIEHFESPASILALRKKVIALKESSERENQLNAQKIESLQLSLQETQQQIGTLEIRNEVLRRQVVSLQGKQMVLTKNLRKSQEDVSRSNSIIDQLSELNRYYSSSPKDVMQTSSSPFSTSNNDSCKTPSDEPIQFEYDYRFKKP
ncbi:MAG: hypothetical protein AB7I18_02205 [Candidatus Berkiella sp.]